MTENNERTEDADRIAADQPAEGSNTPGEATPSTTPHPQDPAEGADEEATSEQ